MAAFCWHVEEGPTGLLWDLFPATQIRPSVFRQALQFGSLCLSLSHASPFGERKNLKLDTENVDSGRALRGGLVMPNRLFSYPRHGHRLGGRGNYLRVSPGFPARADLCAHLPRDHQCAQQKTHAQLGPAEAAFKSTEAQCS